MVLAVSVNGRDLQTAISISVTKDIGTAVGKFDISYSLDLTGASAIRANDRIQIKADGTTVIDGFAERFDMVIMGDERIVNVSGRDKVADLLDSSIRGQKEWSGPISLNNIARQIISNLGVDIDIEDLSGETADFLAADLLSASPGEKCFEFINRLAKKRQVIVTSNNNGDLQFIGDTPFNTGITLLRQDGGQRNNVTRLKVVVDYTNIFNDYRILAQQNPLRRNDQTPPSTIVNTVGQARDINARPARYLEIEVDEDMEERSAQDTADHQASIRRSESFAVETAFAGHSLNGIVPQVGGFMNVVDDKFGLDTRAVVRSFNMIYDSSTSETAVSLSRENAYVKRQPETSDAAAVTGRAVEAEEFI